MSTTVLHSTPANELIEMFRDIIKEELTAHRQAEEEAPSTFYITRQQVCELLHLSLVSVDKFTRQGILKGYRIGGRIRYKRHEVEKSLTAIKDAKYRRTE